MMEAGNQAAIKTGGGIKLIKETLIGVRGFAIALCAADPEASGLDASVYVHDNIASVRNV